MEDELNKRDSDDNRPVLIFAQDEGRFGRISDARKAWAPLGVRPVAPLQVVRQYVYAFTAVCPALGKMTSLILPWANSDMMSIFLEQVSNEYKEYYILMLVDNAGWHISGEVIVPENIRLIRQPAHSPELNPVEHIWEEIREKHFYNKALKTLDDVEQTLCNGLIELNSNPEKVRSMTNFPYLNITYMNAT